MLILILVLLSFQGVMEAEELCDQVASENGFVPHSLLIYGGRFYVFTDAGMLRVPTGTWSSPITAINLYGKPYTSIEKPESPTVLQVINFLKSYLESVRVRYDICLEITPAKKVIQKSLPECTITLTLVHGPGLMKLKTVNNSDLLQLDRNLLFSEYLTFEAFFRTYTGTYVLNEDGTKGFWFFICVKATHRNRVCMIDVASFWERTIRPAQDASERFSWWERFVKGVDTKPSSYFYLNSYQYARPYVYDLNFDHTDPGNGKLVGQSIMHRNKGEEYAFSHNPRGFIFKGTAYLVDSSRKRVLVFDVNPMLQAMPGSAPFEVSYKAEDLQDFFCRAPDNTPRPKPTWSTITWPVIDDLEDVSGVFLDHDPYNTQGRYAWSILMGGAMTLTILIMCLVWLLSSFIGVPKRHRARGRARRHTDASSTRDIIAKLSRAFKISTTGPGVSVTARSKTPRRKAPRRF